MNVYDNALQRIQKKVYRATIKGGAITKLSCAKYRVKNREKENKRQLDYKNKNKKVIRDKWNIYAKKNRKFINLQMRLWKKTNVWLPMSVVKEQHRNLLKEYEKQKRSVKT